MGELRITLRGPAAIGVLAAFFVVPEICQLATVGNAPAQITPTIVSRLKAGYMRDVFCDFGDCTKLIGGSESEGLEAVQRIRELNKLQIANMSIKTFGPGAVAQVEVSIDGKAPPDGAKIRYYNLYQYWWGSWGIKNETTSGAYNWRLW